MIWEYYLVHIYAIFWDALEMKPVAAKFVSEMLNVKQKRLPEEVAQ